MGVLKAPCHVPCSNSEIIIWETLCSTSSHRLVADATATAAFIFAVYPSILPYNTYDASTPGQS